MLHRRAAHRPTLALRPDDLTHLLMAFVPLLVLTLAARWLSFLIGPDVPAVIALVMSLGALPALLLHWARPSALGLPTLVMGCTLAVPGTALTLQLWHDWLVAHGVAPAAPLLGVAVASVLVQALALRASRPAAYDG